MDAFYNFKRGYTATENEKIVKFIIGKKAHNRIKAISLYKEIEDSKLFPGRTARALQSHFKRVIIRDIRKYCNESNARIFERNWKKPHQGSSKNQLKDFFDEEEEEMDEDDLLPDQLKKNPQAQKNIRSYFAPRSRQNQHGSASQGSSHQERASSSQQAPTRREASQHTTQAPTRREISQRAPTRRGASQQSPTRREVSQHLHDTDGVWLPSKPSRSQTSQSSPVRLVPIKIGAQKETLASKPSLHLNEVLKADVNTEKFTRTEDRKILEHLAKNINDVSDLKSETFWQNLKKGKPLPGRSWQSVRHRFHELQEIRLDYLGMPVEVLRKVNLSANVTQKLQKHAQGYPPELRASLTQPVRTDKTQAAVTNYDVDKDSDLGALIKDSSLNEATQSQSRQRSSRIEHARRVVTFDNPQPSTSRDNNFMPPPRATQRNPPRNVGLDSSPTKSFKTFEKVPSGVPLYHNSQQQHVEQTVSRVTEEDIQETCSIIESEISGITNNFVCLFKNTKTIGIAAQAERRMNRPQEFPREETQNLEKPSSSVKPSQSKPSSKSPHHKEMAKILSEDENDSDTEHQARRKKKTKERKETQDKEIQTNMSQITSNQSIIKSNLVTKHTQSSNEKNPQEVNLISDDEGTIPAPNYDSDSSDDRRRKTVNEKDGSDSEHLVYESDSITDSDSDKEEEQQQTQNTNTSSLLDALENIHAQSFSQGFTQVSELFIQESQDMNTQMTNSPGKDNLDTNSNDSNETIFDDNAQEGPPSPLVPQNKNPTPSVGAGAAQIQNANQQPQISTPNVHVLPQNESPTPPVGITTAGAAQIQNANNANQQRQIPTPNVLVLPQGIQDPIRYLQTNGMVPPNFGYPMPQAGPSGVMQPVFNPQIIYMMPAPAPPPPPPQPQKIYIIKKSGKKRKIKKSVNSNTAWTVTRVSESSDEGSPPEKKRQLGSKTKTKIGQRKQTKPENNNNNNVPRSKTNSKKQKITPKKKLKKKKNIKKTSNINKTTGESSNKVLTRHQVAVLSKSQEDCLISEDESIIVLSEEEDNSNITRNFGSLNKSNTSSSSESKKRRREESEESSTEVETSDGDESPRVSNQEDENIVEESTSEDDEAQGHEVITRAIKTALRRSPRISEGASELARLAMQGKRT